MHGKWTEGFTGSNASGQAKEAIKKRDERQAARKEKKGLSSTERKERRAKHGEARRKKGADRAFKKGGMTGYFSYAKKLGDKIAKRKARKDKRHSESES